ncbi:MAG TPA: BON domain-containing protein [Gemmatimonadaceae bacterium]|nr:BON domain-containing protein [Gemmatimonadaceae bacterium]
MAHLRYRDDDSASRGAMFLAAGALAGFAAGVLLAQRVGGLSAIGSRVRDRLGRGAAEEEGYRRGQTAYDEEEEYDDLEAELSPEEELEERVLEAFRNDPVLSERAIDIGALGEGIIELTGWVHSTDEIAHAMTVTRGVPDVETVVNRLTVREEEEELADAADRYESENPEGRMGGQWEGQQVGTGRRRQGTSAEVDRHADPKPVLEEKWTDTQEAIREAADDLEGIAERRARRGAGRGDRTGGAPVAPTGVPKGDHVADPEAGRPDVPGRGDLPGRGG